MEIFKVSFGGVEEAHFCVCCMYIESFKLQSEYMFIPHIHTHNLVSEQGYEFLHSNSTTSSLLPSVFVSVVFNEKNWKIFYWLIHALFPFNLAVLEYYMYPFTSSISDLSY